MPVNFYLSVLQKYLVYNYRQILLSLAITYLSFPYYELEYSPGLDNALPWVFNYFADGHLSQARHTLFPHGTLSFLIHPLPYHNNLIVCILVTFVCSVLLSINLFRIYKFLKPENLVFVTLISLFLHTLLDIKLILICLTLSHLLLFHLSRRKVDLALALFFCVFNLFIKTYGGILCISLIATETAYLLLRKNFKSVVFIILGLILCFFGFWLALYGTFDGVFTFLRGQVELASDNSEGARLFTRNNWFLITICVLGLIAIPFVSKEAPIKHIILLMVLPIFAGWKHAMARADGLHVPGFLNLLLVLTLFIWLIERKNKIRTLLVCATSIAAFMLNMGAGGYLEQRMTSFRPFYLYTLVAKYDKLGKIKNENTQRLIQSKVVLDTFLKLIGRSTVDVYPWNYDIIAANHFNWAPRPVLHSYAAYTVGWMHRMPGTFSR